MKVVVHFLNGNDSAIQEHYQMKEYRDDIILEIDSLFYEIYFYVEDVLKYEMRIDGFMTYPGLIILDEISNEKILNAIEQLINMKYFEYFVGKESIPLDSRFVDKMIPEDATNVRFANIVSHCLRS